jgi:hypothetical protein
MTINIHTVFVAAALIWAGAFVGVLAHARWGKRKNT